MIMSANQIVKSYIFTQDTPEDRKNIISKLADDNLVSEQEIVDILRSNKCVVPPGYYRTTVGSRNPATLQQSDTDISSLQFTIKQLLAENEALRSRLNIPTRKNLYPANIMNQFNNKNAKNALEQISRGIRWLCLPVKENNGKKKHHCTNSTGMTNEQYAKYIEVFSKITEYLKEYEYKEDK